MYAQYFSGSRRPSRISSRWRLVSGHLRGGHEVEIPVARDLEQVGLELRQVPGAGERGRIDEERRRHLGVAVLAGVKREHEVDQRPGQLRAVAHQEREARAGHPRGALEIEDAERGPEVPMRLRLEVEDARFADAPHLEVVRGARPDGHPGRGQIRERPQPRAPLLFDRVEVRFEPLDRLAALAICGEHGARVAPFLLRAGDLLAGRVLIALERLDLDNHRAPARVERRKRVEVGVGVDAAVPEAGPHDVRVIADERWIDHGKRSYTMVAAIGRY